MSSPITFSNFNSIDFNTILNAVMTQESQPLQALQTRQSNLTAAGSAYATLATKLGALETAATDLSTPDAVEQFAATVSDTTALTATAGSDAIAGRYEVVVQELARSQVTASSTTAAETDVIATGGKITIGGVDVEVSGAVTLQQLADLINAEEPALAQVTSSSTTAAETDVIATGGKITIGGVDVAVSEAVTLQGLADLINANDDVVASASVVESSPDVFKLVLTGKDTGAAAAFTITNADLLTGGAGIGFTDTDSDGTSGDSAEDNDVQATDAWEVGATATVVQSSPDVYRLVLTGKETGADAAFTITNADLLTGGIGVDFTDTDSDGTSGDSEADNAVQATNASVLINHVEVTSASNTLTAGIPGTTLTLAQKDENKTIVVSVARDNTALVNKIQTFVSAYNDVMTFARAQMTAAGNGQSGTLGHEPVLRQLGNTLRAVVGGKYGSGTYTHLAEVGVGFSRTGGLTVNRSILNAALRDHPSSVAALLAVAAPVPANGAATTGAFGAMEYAIHSYTRSGGFIPSAQKGLNAQWNRLNTQITDMQSRLAIRRAALQREYIAADRAMSQLKAQSGTLSSFGSSNSSGGLFANS